MKIRNLIRQSKRNWDKVGDSDPAMKTKGQTEFTWENHYMLKRQAEEFDNREVNFVSSKLGEQDG